MCGPDHKPPLPGAGAGAGAGPMYLASRSPRRQKMLTEAGLAPIVRPAGFDDGELTRGCVSEAQWVMALAYCKARWVHGTLRREGVETGTVLGADTVCVNNGEIYGQPVDGDRRSSSGTALTRTERPR